MSFWDRVERGANTKIRRVSVRSAFDPVPNFTKQNPPGLATITRITLEIELFTALNCFVGAVKTQKLMGAPFLFELVAICHSYKPYSTALTCKYCALQLLLRMSQRKL